MSDGTIPISEIFGPTIQGEGVLLGVPTVFVRSGACDYRCVWCDTGYAVLPEHRDTWVKMTTKEILDKCEELCGDARPIITLSGGNPALHDDFAYMINPAKNRRFRVAMETQGSVFKEWFELLNYLIVSPKPPSSGMANNFNPKVIYQCVVKGPARTSLKIPIFTREDYDFAVKVHRDFPQAPMYFSTGNQDASIYQSGKVVDKGALLNHTKQIAEWVLQDGLDDVIVTPQLHTLLWGGKRGY